jgi:chromosome partitioning protein
MAAPPTTPAFTFALANGKGGVGKTTTAVLIADLLGYKVGRTILIDLDPSAAATTWAMLAEREGRPLHADVTQIPAATEPATMPRLIRQATAGYEWAVLDNPPFDQSRMNASVEAALMNGGMAIVPTSTTDLDLPQTVVTVDDIGDRVPVVVLLTQTVQRTTSQRTARQGLENVGITVLTTEVPLRESLRSAPSRPLDATGRSGGLSPAEIYEPVVVELLALYASNTTTVL